MPTAAVILPSSTYRAADFTEAADAIGVELVVVSENPPPFDMGDRYLQVPCHDPIAAAERIAELADRVGLDAVVAADDQGVMVAAHAATLLGLPGNRPEAAARTRDKLEMRRRLAEFEVDQPRFLPLAPGDPPAEAVAALGPPVVIKPRHRSASQGVIRVDRPQDAAEVAREVREIVADQTATLLVEEYLGGEEIAVEGLVDGSGLNVLATFHKPDVRQGPHFPETILVTPSRLPTAALHEAHRVAAEAVRALELDTGPVHIELMVEGERARVIEVAARSIGGLCSRSLSFGLLGSSLETLILRNAMEMERSRLRREAVASGVLMIPVEREGTFRGIAGEAAVRAIPAVTGIDLTMRSGDRVVPPPWGDRYLGFVFARAGTPEEVEKALREAMEKIQVQVEG